MGPQREQNGGLRGRRGFAISRLQCRNLYGTATRAIRRPTRPQEVRNFPIQTSKIYTEARATAENSQFRDFKIENLHATTTRTKWSPARPQGVRNFMISTSEIYTGPQTEHNGGPHDHRGFRNLMI
jgi:hypothetical protein